MKSLRRGQTNRLEIDPQYVLHFGAVSSKSVFQLTAINNHIVITTCANRKRVRPSARLVGSVLAAGKPDKTARVWGDNLRRSGVACAATELYLGRAFREAERAADSLEAQFFVVSAGLGLVRGDRPVPSYSLTLAQTSPDSILAKTGSEASIWWQHLKANSIFHQDLPPARGLILAALSQPYLEMIGEELSGWHKERRSRLRLFIKQDPSRTFPRLSDQWMPYDDRLDLLGEDYAGTQGDFAQRAMRHFAEHFARKPGEAERHAAQVQKSLAGLVLRERQVRNRITDEEILAHINRDWDKADGRSARMLRHLRDELNLACEQSRFKRLFGLARDARARRT